MARASNVAKAVTATYPACAVTTATPSLDDISILINATPVGLSGKHELPVAVTSLPGHLTVVDIAAARSTRLLALAEAFKCTAIAGSAMVEGQADAVLDFLWHDPTASDCASAIPWIW